MKKIINYEKNKKKFFTITAAAISVLLVVSVGIIGAAPFSVQQQGTERAPGQSVTSSNIVDGEVRNQDLADNAVTSDKIANGEVTSADIEDGTITSTDIAEGTIPPPDDGTPPDDSVTSATIVDETITSEDIGDGQVTSADVADGSIGAADLAPDAIPPPTGGGTPQITITDSESVQVPPGQFRSLVATCPPGTVVTGGGFDTTFTIHITQSTPELDGGGWRASGLNEGSNNGAFTAFAVCQGPTT